MRLLSLPTAFGGSALSGLFLAVCPAQAIDATYRCSDRTTLRATFTNVSGRGSVALAMPGTAITLPQVMSADGGRYAKGGTEFWIKGREASFTRGGKNTTCKTSD